VIHQERKTEVKRWKSITESERDYCPDSDK